MIWQPYIEHRGGAEPAILLSIEQECRINHDWNCQNVPAGTHSATTRARKMLEIADELRTLLDATDTPQH